MQFLNALLYILLSVSSLFLICLVLIQRGKGGGLAGAFGGAGGSSAFGTKAGDVFTRVTMITAGIWISIAMLLVVLSNRRPSAWASTPSSSSAKSDFTPSNTIDLGKKGTAGASVDIGTGLPIPKPKDTTKAPVPDVSGGSPAAPEPLTPLPAPK